MVSSLFWRYKMKKIRELRADEIEVRVGVVRKNGISLLLYKDARCDMNILDETFGIAGWQRKHELINGALFCTVSIKDENGEWISKQDVGVESYTEAVKGAASDSFKRACFNIGIGRELYTAPFIWIPSDTVSIAEGDGKLKVRDSFFVSYISYDESGRVIKSLEIRNQRKEVVYQINMENKSFGQISQPEKTRPISDYRMKKLQDEMQRTGVTEQQIIARYHVSLANITEIDYKRIMNALKKTDSKVA